MSTPVTPMPGRLGRVGVDLAGPLEGDAELVLRLAGGDLGVGLGVDVGIDADGDRGASLPSPWRSREMQLELGLGFDVEAEDAGVEREARSRARSCRRRRRRSCPAAPPAASARRSSPSETTSMPGALRDEGANHRLVGVRLHGVADQRVEAGEGLAEDAVVAHQRRRRIAVEGRADRAPRLSGSGTSSAWSTPSR